MFFVFLFFSLFVSNNGPLLFFFFFYVTARQDSFQQHDVQELCRVLFDALETTFQGTVNETLVNNLYQGEEYVCAGGEEGRDASDHVVCPEGWKEERDGVKKMNDRG